MVSNVNKETDFSSVVITNDYACLVGGTWTAQLQDGKTVYVSSDGKQTIEGPVNLIGADLIITNGAVVDNAVIVGSASRLLPTITVQTGGTIQNSDVFNGTINIASGGVSSSNSCVSVRILLSAGSESLNDTFYCPGNTGASSGTLNLSQLPANTQTNFPTSTQEGYVTLEANAKLVNPSSPDISQNNSISHSASQLLLVGGSGYYGSSNIAQATHPDYSDKQFTLTNNYPSYIGEVWTASLVDGKTVYSNSTGTVTNIEGPINLIRLRQLTVNPGAVVDGINIIGRATAPTLVINNGIIRNSFIAHATVTIGSETGAAISQNNTYISCDTTLSFKGSLSKQDYFYEPGTSYGNYNLTNSPSGLGSTFLMGDGKGRLTLYPETVFDSSYIGAAPNATMTVARYTGVIESTDADQEVCFLEGTLIHTIEGHVPVETIQIGDHVITYHKTGLQTRRITWVGFKQIFARTRAQRSEAGYPVRIVKNAIADGVPYKDLLVTEEHCLFFDDQFIPARMLVNDYSIYYDNSITEYTYYHIETEDHSVIMADGMLTESYLDTGNRRYFEQKDNVRTIYNKRKQWSIDSAHPLIVAKEIVEPIYHKFLNRAKQLDYKCQAIEDTITEDSNLHLIMDNGDTIYSTHQKKDRYFFVIPSEISKVRLVSRTSKSSQVVGSFMDDRRPLGVLVGSIILMKKNAIYPIDDHFLKPRLDGWDVKEQSACRWTNGNALLSIKNQNSDSNSILVIEVLAGGPYILETYENIEQRKVVNQ